MEVVCCYGHCPSHMITIYPHLVLYPYSNLLLYLLHFLFQSFHPCHWLFPPSHFAFLFRFIAPCQSSSDSSSSSGSPSSSVLFQPPLPLPSQFRFFARFPSSCASLAGFNPILSWGMGRYCSLGVEFLSLGFCVYQLFLCGGRIDFSFGLGRDCCSFH